MKRFPQLLLILLTGFGLWTGSMAVRRAVLSQQTKSVGDDEAPFILEAALQYRMTREVYDTGRLEAFDLKVQYPEGIHRWRTYSIGAEFVYAPLARLLPKNWTLINRIRWVSTALFCLAVPLAALWAGLGWKSWWAGISSGFILMVSPAFAVRSSGLALSRENLAFPVMMLFLVMDQLIRRNPRSAKRIAVLVMAGLSAGFSQIFWDFSQYLFGLWALIELVTVLRRPAYAENRRLYWCSVTIGLILASVVHPYLRGQGFLFSPVMILCMVLNFFAIRRFGHRKRYAILFIFIAFAVVWTLIGRAFVSNYSHFGELLQAKIHYLNQKPFDPSVLSYAQRIMWTPALNSSTWELTIAYFPGILWALLLGFIFLFRVIKQSADEFPRFLFISLLVTVPMYVLFFRMHVYLILFAAVVIGGMIHGIANVSRKPRLAQFLALALLFIIPCFETYRMLFFDPTNTKTETTEQAMMRRALEEMGLSQKSVFNRWGHPGQSYQALTGLTTALRELNAPDAPVLAGFGVSGSILTDTGMPILLHPKFESPGIRERVREFYEHLYRKTEREFRDWAVDNGAQFYVHAFGSLGGKDPRETPRYMVDAVEPPAHAGVYTLERSPREAVWFQPLWSNERYQIFRIVTDEDLEFSDTLMELAYAAASRGDSEYARRLAWRVLSDYHWKHEGAKALIGVLGLPPETDR